MVIEYDEYDDASPHVVGSRKSSNARWVSSESSVYAERKNKTLMVIARRQWSQLGWFRVKAGDL